ncbi:MAG TPA: CHAP domain-containing protein [Chthoniobacteraceae bacterium]|nr:CHAP domain-containing protein [Chthoniobacteraceae bacterium]
MKWFALVPVCFLAACSPGPETDVAPPVKPTVKDAPAADPWPDRFRQVHGTVYDAASRVDREKMAVLKGESVVKESLTTPTVRKSLIVADRQTILDVGRKLVGTTEKTGKNDGPVIEAIQKSVGIQSPGDPYCAAFNYWCYQQAGHGSLAPRSGWSPDWVRSPTWTTAKGGRTPKPADAFGIYFASKKRVAHTGLIETWGDSSAVTLEGNTSPSAEFGAASDRDGDGIWRKRRLIRQIYAVRDWVE